MPRYYVGLPIGPVAIGIRLGATGNGEEGRIGMTKKEKRFSSGLVYAIVVSFCFQLFAGVGTVSAEQGNFELTLQFTNLADPGNDHYEGWLIVSGSPVSTGKFTVDASGNILDLEGNAIDKFTVNDIDMDDATDFVLSLEPDGDTDSVPANIKPLAGALNTAKDSATLEHNIGVDLSSVSGEFILATPTDDAEADDYNLDLDFTNLAELATGHYEGWLIVSGAPVSTGKFKMSASGDILDLSDQIMTDPFLVAGLDIVNVTDFVLSIEAEGDTDSIPGDVKPMAGAYDSIAMGGPLSHNIGVDLSSVSGEYILATPTDDPAGNELSGVWFLNTTGPAAGLMIPDLTGTDWMYEGWAVIGGTPVTSGRFNMASEADDFNGYSETVNPGPPFPGEDFLLNAPSGLTFPTDLSDQTMVVSIEPRVDSDPGPFQFKPLVGTVPSMATDHTEYQMTDNTATLPTGTFDLMKAPSNENSGIWFLNRSGTPVAGLSLPDLTGTDWTYEGWVVISGTPVTTGTFDADDVADGFDGYSSTGSAPPFPGEDFLTNAPAGLTFPTDLAGMTAVISIEPRVDNDPGPFQFKPLVGTIPADATDHSEYPMEDKVSTMATGTVSISEVEQAEEDMTMTYLLLAIVIIIVVIIGVLLFSRRGKATESAEPEFETEEEET
jgi:hypothetical protein